MRPGTTGKRAIRSGLVISVVLGAQLFVGSLIGTPAGAAGILPPSDPPANIGFDLAPNCTAVDDVSATCIDSLLHDINAGRNSEGVAPMVLPNGFTQMSDEEQILVLANLERGDRGLSQFAGLSSTLIQASGFGALANDDPSPPAGYPFYQWGSNYADSINPLEADFLWMYDDGVGGTNYDCMGSNFTGCWGHRNNILGPWNSNGAQTTEMGDAATATGVYTELFANKAGGADPMVDPYSSVTYPHQVAPQVISVSPTGVTSPGTGTPVTIEGNYFSLYSAGQTPVVDFGSVPATNVHVSWDGTLTADAPANPLGASGDVVAITVTTPAGTSSSTANSSDTFTYSGTPLPTVTSISPSSGSQDGGTQVTITGGNLGLTNVVDFGATPAPTFRINSNSSITATAPPSSTLGPVNVVAKTTVNASSTSSNDLFTYKRDATVTPTVSSNTSSQGASLTYAATVGGNGATPTGTVTFSSGWNIVCTAALVDGTGSCQTSTTPPGSDTITAIYSGDANYVVSSGTVNVVVTSGEYTPLVVPTRICDSRPGNVSKLSGPAAQCNGPSNAGSPIGGGGTKVINVAGSFGVPADATAVVLNVTMVNTTAPGYLTVYPTGTSQPDASNLNYGTGETVPNLVEVATGTNGDVSFYASSQSNIVVDVEGYVSTTASSGAGAGLYDPLPAPVRICDTRANNFSTLSGANTQCNGPGNSGERLSAGGTISVQVAGIDGVPSNVSAVVLNVTVANPSAAGYLTVYPEGASQPTASNVNYAAGETAANRVTVPLSSNGTPGRISIYSSSPTDVVVDISGYYSAAGGTGNQYTTETSPVRICDTRAGNPSQLSGTYAQCFNKPIDPSGNLTLQVAGLAGVPTGAKAVVVNLTAVAPTMPTYLTIYPGPNRTSSSDLNPAAGETRANLSVATINANGTITVYNNTGSVNVVVDVLGWYS